jgi:6-phosphogluconolactonase (cycloisomerase 2 family)
MNIFHRQIAGGYSNSAMLCEKRDLYLTEYWTSTLHTFVRDTVTGDLTYNKKYQNGDSATFKGLYRPSGAVESYDGKNVYTINSSDGIVVFAKADTSGGLIYRRLIASNDPANNWSKRILSVACSKDNKYLYAVSNGRKICIFKRDVPNDSLVLVDSVANVPGFNLYDFIAIKSSPDGRFFHVLSTYGTKICVFRYNDGDGSLSFVETYDFQNSYGGGISEIKCSPDGKFMFTTSYSSMHVAMFKRNTSTGQIGFLHNYQYFPNQSNQGVLDFAVSNDGKNLYAVSMYSDAINTYEIDYENEMLLPVEALYLGGISNSQFYFSNAIDLSTDDRFVYLASRDSSSMKLLFRDAKTGRLTLMKTFTEKGGDFEGFEGISSLVVSRNARNLYLTSEYENSVSYYKLLMNLGPDVEACDGDTVVVRAGANYVDYKWSTMETGSSINLTQSGVYSVVVTDLFGNMEYDTLRAVFYPLPELELGENSGICQGDSILLDAGSGAISYTWNTGGTGQQLIISDSGNYTVHKISEHGCISFDSVMVSVFSLPVPDLGVDTTIYKGQAFELEVPGFESYLWYDGSTASSVIIDSASFATNPLMVWVTVKNENQCANSDTVVMTYIDSGIGIATDELPGLLISPNPFGDFLVVKCNALVETLNLVDMHGITVLQMEINATEAFIPTQRIPDGNYLLHLVVKGKNHFYKVIRNK